MSYTIRQANEKDIPAIIDLFKLSLGTEGGAPVESFWRWKHLQNPFGVSPVLLAFDGDRLIGLRAFMRWTWQLNGSTYQAFRAVDTATHPDYRGKGIFSRLTKQLISELAGSEPSTFIYNTPNDQSKPGYLKMGWQVLGKAPVVASFRFAYNPQAPARFATYAAAMKRKDWSAVSLSAVKDRISRLNSVQYLKWRYQDIPELPYGSFEYETGGHRVHLFFHLKKRARLHELRICDYAGVDAQKDGVLLIRAFKALAGELGTPVITFCNSIPLTVLQKYFYSVYPVNRFAPEITVRKIGDEALFDSVNDIKKWSFTMGDLELF